MSDSSPAVRASLRAVLAFALALLVALAPAAADARAIAPRGELTSDERLTIDIFEHAKRSVVYISTTQRVMDPWTRNVRSIPSGTGSGFVWDEDGTIVTNYHVVNGAAEARIRLNDGRDYPAMLIGASPSHDLALLRIKVPSNPPPPLPIGSSRDLRVGQKVYAIGNPFGLDWTLTTGIVSALDRALDNDEGHTIEHLIQTDAPINPGNSGGPLLDSAGRVIGMSTAIYSPTGASAGIGFAVPIDTINRVATVLIEHGKYVSPSLGIEMDDGLNDALAERLGVEGVFVLKVNPGGPAARAGLRGARIERGYIVPGDVIVAIEGKPVTSVARLEARLDDFSVGQRVRLGIVRDGRRMSIEATLGPGS